MYQCDFTVCAVAAAVQAVLSSADRCPDTSHLLPLDTISTEASLSYLLFVKVFTELGLVVSDRPGIFLRLSTSSQTAVAPQSPSGDEVPFSSIFSSKSKCHSWQPI